MTEVTSASTGARRAWAYLAERFPPGPSALLAALHTAGGFAVVQALGHPLSAWRLGVAAAVVLLFLLALRLGDESKDFARDREIHPGRLVQRGIVRLAEVRRAEIAVVVVQGVLAATLGTASLLAWLALAGYAALMRVEFFAGDWLEPRPITYALTHQPVMLTLTGFVHVAAGARLAELTSTTLLLHQALALAAMFAFEVSRKLRVPGDEHPANRTYSQVHGPRVAGVFAAGLVAAAALAIVGLLGRGYLPALVLAVPAAVFAVRPTPRTARAADLAGQLTLVVLHAALAARLWSLS